MTTQQAEKYNGWTNWDTWNAYNWLTHDEDVYIEAQECQDTQELREFWEEHFPNLDGISTDKIDFNELIEGLEDE